MRRCHLAIARRRIVCHDAKADFLGQHLTRMMPLDLPGGLCSNV
jgi:hypothetical protein